MNTLPRNWTQCPCGMKLPPKKSCPVCKPDGKIKKAAIPIKKYKLGTFTRILQENNLVFEKCEGLTSDTLILFVYTNNPKCLLKVIGRANRIAITENN